MAYNDPQLLLPGFGGKVTITLSNTQTSGWIDMSRVAQFAAVLTSETGANSVQLQQSFDGVNAASLGAPLAGVGDHDKYDITDGPHGLIRVVQTGAGSGTVTIVGWPIQTRQ